MCKIFVALFIIGLIGFALTFSMSKKKNERLFVFTHNKEVVACTFSDSYEKACSIINKSIGHPEFSNVLVFDKGSPQAKQFFENRVPKL